MWRITWDREKERLNLAKHGVAFYEAASVVRQTLSRWELDLAPSAGEDRFHVTGYSWHGRLLAVTVAEGGATIQIISARRAMKRERHEYEDT